MTTEVEPPPAAASPPSASPAASPSPASPLGEQRLHAIVEHTFDTIAIIDAQGIIRFEPPHAFATRAHRGPPLLTEFVLESAAYGCRVHVQVSGEVPGGRLGAKLAEGFLRQQLAASLERLRGLCEREARAAAAGEPTSGDPACWLHVADQHDD